MCLRSPVFLFMLFAAPLCAHADTFRLNFSVAGQTDSVLLTANTTSTKGEFLITAASGTINSEAASLLAQGSYPSVGPNDNLLFYPLTSGQSSFDVDGVSFVLADGTDYNVYQQAGQYFATVGPQRAVGTINTLSVMPASTVTPEPSSLALLSTGVLALGGALRRRSARSGSF